MESRYKAQLNKNTGKYRVMERSFSSDSYGELEWKIIYTGDEERAMEVLEDLRHKENPDRDWEDIDESESSGAVTASSLEVAELRKQLDVLIASDQLHDQNKARMIRHFMAIRNMANSDGMPLIAIATRCEEAIQGN